MPVSESVDVRGAEGEGAMLFSTFAMAHHPFALLFGAAAIAVFAGFLIWAAAVDARRRIIPNAAVAAGCAGWLVLLVAAELAGIDVRVAAASGLAAGLLLLAGLLVFAVVFERASGRASMGGGDIKLLAACGLYLGLVRALVALMAACILALAVEAVRAGFRPGPCAQDAFAFGPAIAVASCAVAVCEAMLPVL